MSGVAEKDGGPAFPLHHYTGNLGPDGAGFAAKDSGGESHWVNAGCAGMSLRGYFAVQALVMLNCGISLTPAGVAREAYSIADAMIAERENR